MSRASRGDEFYLRTGRKGARVKRDMQQSLPRAWVEVDSEAIAHNLGVAQRVASGMKMMPVVKANAYGHGMEAVARRLDREKPAFFGVANAEEARRLEASGVSAPPFLLGPVPPQEREEVAQRGWGCTISSWEEALHFASLATQAGRVMPVHLALDTGMGREGIQPQELGELLPRLMELSSLRLEGVMSHCPAADEDENFTREQIDLFTRCVQEIRQYAEPRFVHMSASAGLLGYKVPGANLVRPGLMLYGVAPVPSTAATELQPTLRLLARVSLVRDLPAGHGVSYGRTFITPRPTRVATLGIGYADGWQRHLSGSGIAVSLRGTLCPMLGRVTMDQIMVDVSGVRDVVAGDEAELIGRRVTVEEVARRAGTIPWDIFTGLGQRLPRVYEPFRT